MTSLANPQLGKKRFEMLCLAVSIINGCDSCTKAHEAAVRREGLSVDQVHDVARIAAIVKGIESLEVIELP